MGSSEGPLPQADAARLRKAGVIVTLCVYRVDAAEGDHGRELIVAHSPEEALAMWCPLGIARPALMTAWRDGMPHHRVPMPVPDDTNEPAVLTWGDERWDRYYYEHGYTREEEGQALACDGCDRGDFPSIPESHCCQGCRHCIACTIDDDPDDPCEDCADDVEAYLCTVSEQPDGPVCGDAAEPQECEA